MDFTHLFVYSILAFLAFVAVLFVMFAIYAVLYFFVVGAFVILTIMFSNELWPVSRYPHGPLIGNADQFADLYKRLTVRLASLFSKRKPV